MQDQEKYSQNILTKKLKGFVSKGRRRFYLRDIIEETKVSMLEAEDFFIPLLKNGEMEGTLEVRCPKCGAELGVYSKYHDVPEEIMCELCETRFPRSSDYLEIILEVKDAFFRTQEVTI